MSEDSYCTVCAAEESKKTDVSFRIKYAIAAISLFMFVIGIFLEFQRFDLIIFHIPYLTCIFVAGRWIIPRGIKGAVKLHLDINFLMTFAAFGSVVIGAPAEGAMVIYLFYIAELLEELAGARIRTEVESLLELKPDTVNTRRDGQDVCIEVEDVLIGDVILVRPGEKIGIDGIVVKGTSSVNQATITGESLPIEKSVGDEVYAGTLNQDGYLEIEVTKKSDETVLSKVIHFVEETRNKKAPTETLVSRFSHIYTPLVVLGSFLVTVVTYFFGLSIQAAIYRGLTLLVIACPCAFAISIPVTMVSAITGFMRNGILVKGSVYVEKLSETYVVAFDKTGTLTEGTLSLKEIKLVDESLRDEVLTALVSLEWLSEHPIAISIKEASVSWNIVPEEVEEFQSFPGKGLRGIVQGIEYVIGNRTFLSAMGVELNTNLLADDTYGTQVFIVRQYVHTGTILLSDSIRKESKRTIHALKLINVHSVMLTGDNELTAAHVARDLEIDEFHSELLPKDKVSIVETLTSSGSVIMVGDGVNDAPALAVADVGIAMAAISSDVAIETSDVALMDADLSKIVHLVNRSKKAMSVVKQNVASAIGVKLLLGILALPGLVPLWLAVGLGDMGISLLVIANALRLAIK